jgi:hypothetical protein
MLISRKTSRYMQRARTEMELCSISRGAEQYLMRYDPLCNFYLIMLIILIMLIK